MRAWILPGLDDGVDLFLGDRAGRVDGALRPEAGGMEQHVTLPEQRFGAHGVENRARESTRVNQPER